MNYYIISRLTLLKLYLYSYTVKRLKEIEGLACISNFVQVCAGSSLFLRARYGNGYYLTLVRDDGITKPLEDPEKGQQLELLASSSDPESTSMEEVMHD